MKNLSPIVFSILSFVSFSSESNASAEHDLYSRVFPAHVEYCAMSKISPKTAGRGGIGGHAALYIEGLCKDPHSAYPTVLPCSQLMARDHLDHSGVGISVDKELINANWVALPGYDFFIHGVSGSPNKAVDELEVNQAAMDEAIRQARLRGVFSGIKYNEVRDGDVDGMASAALGTDFALRFGRILNCIRIPVPEASLSRVADYLNSVNHKYREASSAKDPSRYHWNGFHNNCAQLSANVLEKFGIRKGLKTDVGLLDQLDNIGIPKNGLFELQDLVHHSPISLKYLRKNKIFWQDISEQQWAPVGLGGLSVAYPIYSNNKFFETQLNALWLWPKKIFSGFGIQRRSNRAFENPVTSDLATNLYFWSEKYGNTLITEALTSSDQSEDHQKYIEFLKQQVSRIRKAIESL